MKLEQPSEQLSENETGEGSYIDLSPVIAEGLGLVLAIWGLGLVLATCGAIAIVAAAIQGWNN